MSIPSSHLKASNKHFVLGSFLLTRTSRLGKGNLKLASVLHLKLTSSIQLIFLLLLLKLNVIFKLLSSLVLLGRKNKKTNLRNCSSFLFTITNFRIREVPLSEYVSQRKCGEAGQEPYLTRGERTELRSKAQSNLATSRFCFTGECNSGFSPPSFVYSLFLVL